MRIPSCYCREEIENHEAELRKATGLGGKSRDLNNPFDNLRPTIYGSLKRAFKKLRQSNPPMTELASHFDNSISSELGAFIYSPTGNVPVWTLENPTKKVAL